MPAGQAFCERAVMHLNPRSPRHTESLAFGFDVERAHQAIRVLGNRVEPAKRDGLRAPDALAVGATFEAPQCCANGFQLVAMVRIHAPSQGSVIQVRCPVRELVIPRVAVGVLCPARDVGQWWIVIAFTQDGEPGGTLHQQAFKCFEPTRHVFPLCRDDTVPTHWYH